MIYLPGNQTKRDYRVAALVIPTPTPERPGDRLEDMIAQSRFLGKWRRLCGLRYAGTHVDTTDAQKAPQPVRGRCVTSPRMMKALLIFAHYAEVILHMCNYAETST